MVYELIYNAIVAVKLDPITKFVIYMSNLTLIKIKIASAHTVTLLLSINSIFNKIFN